MITRYRKIRRQQTGRCRYTDNESPTSCLPICWKAVSRASPWRTAWTLPSLHLDSSNSSSRPRTWSQICRKRTSWSVDTEDSVANVSWASVLAFKKRKGKVSKGIQIWDKAVPMSLEPVFRPLKKERVRWVRGYKNEMKRCRCLLSQCLGF